LVGEKGEEDGVRVESRRSMKLSVGRNICLRPNAQANSTGLARSGLSWWLDILLIGIIVSGFGFPWKVEAARKIVVNLTESGYVANAENVIIGNIAVDIKNAAAVNHVGGEFKAEWALGDHGLIGEKNKLGCQLAHGFWIKSPIRHVTFTLPRLAAKLVFFDESNRMTMVPDGKFDSLVAYSLGVQRTIKSYRQPGTFQKSQTFFLKFQGFLSNLCLTLNSTPLGNRSKGIDNSYQQGKKANQNSGIGPFSYGKRDGLWPMLWGGILFYIGAGLCWLGCYLNNRALFDLRGRFSLQQWRWFSRPVFACSFINMFGGGSFIIFGFWWR